jgi:hypothetical protein
MEIDRKTYVLAGSHQAVEMTATKYSFIASFA